MRYREETERSTSSFGEVVRKRERKRTKLFNLIKINNGRTKKKTKGKRHRFRWEKVFLTQRSNLPLDQHCNTAQKSSAQPTGKEDAPAHICHNWASLRRQEWASFAVLALLSLSLLDAPPIIRNGGTVGLFTRHVIGRRLGNY